ncbi:MAG: extracellular solute-binding protein [Chloroflexota bacterium]
MPVLDLSVNVHFLESVHVLRRLLDDFQQANDCSVALRVVPGNAAWRTQAYYALHGRGADVSEVGSTWISGLAMRETLRTFSPADISALGGREAFFSSLWQPSTFGQAQLPSIPFLGDVRLIFYWRDMLSRAGVDEQGAFASQDQVHETFHKLGRIHRAPWAVQTLSDTHDIVYASCSWVWGAGGNFIDSASRRTVFNEPAARRGLRAYFSLHPFFPTGMQPLNIHQLADIFCQRRVAAILSGPWVLNYLARNLDEDLFSQIGVALPPGPAFVGGSQLVVWQHTAYEESAVALVKYLLTPDVQRQLNLLTGMLPVLRSVAATEVFMRATPHHVLLLDALEHGCNPALLPGWGLLEEYLATAFGQIWGELLENPRKDVDAVLDKILNPLAVYLDRVFT